jgi:ZIP family zinc transporter
MLGPMLEAFFWGFVGAAFLIVGAVIAFVTDLPPRWRGLILAFGAGALFGAVAYELIGDAITDATSGVVVGIGFGAGALVFYLGSRAVEQMGDTREPSTGPAQHRSPSRRSARTNGLAVVIGSILDGIPESVVLGASLLAGTGVGIPVLVAIAVSNIPEGLSASEDLTEDGAFTRTQVIGLWIGVTIASAVAAAIGYVALDGASPDVAAGVQSFAAGAILAMLAESMIPEAHDIGGREVGLVTALGFAIATFLSFTA